MSERLGYKPGLREGGGVPACQKQPKIAVLQGVWEQEMSLSMSAGCEDGLCHNRQKRVEIP